MPNCSILSMHKPVFQAKDYNTIFHNIINEEEILSFTEKVLGSKDVYLLPIETIYMDSIQICNSYNFDNYLEDEMLNLYDN